MELLQLVAAFILAAIAGMIVAQWAIDQFNEP
jgi:hypothetical protein